MLSLPRSARLAAWSTAWLHGLAALDDTAARVRADDEPHEVVGVPGTDDPVSLPAALRALREAGMRALRVALPVPGDPRGLGGPPGLNGHAVDAGEAAVARGAPYALVPDVTAFGPPGDQGHLVTWRCHHAEPVPSGPPLADAGKALTFALLEAGSTLADLDVASWRPEAAALLDDLRESRVAEPLPRGFPAEAQTVAARAARLLAVVKVALDDDSALSSAAAASRRSTLRPLEIAARDALVAACNALADE